MRSKKGFTLLELLFVMVLIAVMILIVYPKVVNKFNEAKKNTFLTDVKTIIKESNSKYNAEGLKGNIIDYIGYDENIHLDLTNPNLKYCVNLGDKGSVKYLKVTNGQYFIEGIGEEVKSKSASDVKYGDFSNFDCNYVLDEKDLLDDSPITFISKDTYEKVTKYLGIAFIVTLVLALISKKNINR